MVGGHPHYTLGANVLLHSLRASLRPQVLRNTDFIAMITGIDENVGMTKHSLSRHWHACEPPSIGDAGKGKTVLFDKLWVYHMLDYERVMFIDADAFAVGDVSPMLNTPNMKSISVTPDWFEGLPLKAGDAVGFNTGVFSVKPDKDEFFRLNKHRLDHPEIYDDQSCINSYYGGGKTIYQSNSTNVTWFDFSFNAWLNGIAEGQRPSRNGWDDIWNFYNPKVIHHLIGHIPPERPLKNATDPRSVVYKRWWEYADDFSSAQQSSPLSNRRT